MFRDLRSFLDLLEREGQLVHYRDELSPEPDVRALMRGAADMGPTGRPSCSTTSEATEASGWS